MEFHSKDRDIIVAWSKNAELFVRQALKVKLITHQQRELLSVITKLVWAKIKLAEGKKLTDEERDLAHKIGVSVMSGKGNGKDAATAWCILWFLCCFPRALIPCTAPTAHQLRDVLWREINKWRVGEDPSDAPIIKDWVTWQTDKVYFTEAEGKEWYAIGRTANPKASEAEVAETLSGLHENYQMIVADEAAAVNDLVFKDLEGTLTRKCNFMLLIFNPTRDNGYAIDSQFKYRDRWACLQWNSEDSELVTRESIQLKLEKYGRDSNFYRVTVLGQPPLVSSDTLIPYAWAIQAVEADLQPLPEDIEVAGVDVGAGGDASIYLSRRGPKVYWPKQEDTPDSEILTGKLLGHIYDTEPRYVFVDKIGVGWGIYGNLKARIRNPQTTIIGVNVAELPAASERFHRLRDQLCWRVRELFEQREISIPDDPRLIGELTTIKFTEPNGKIKIEAKKDMKARGLDSPNRFDALALTEYYRTENLRRMTTTQADPLWKRRGTSTSWKTV
jgi:phage terminase large subunit